MAGGIIPIVVCRCFSGGHGRRASQIAFAAPPGNPSTGRHVHDTCCTLACSAAAHGRHGCQSRPHGQLSEALTCTTPQEKRCSRRRILPHCNMAQHPAYPLRKPAGVVAGSPSEDRGASFGSGAVAIPVDQLDFEAGEEELGDRNPDTTRPSMPTAAARNARLRRGTLPRCTRWIQAVVATP
jgi:hypothetical protein